MPNNSRERRPPVGSYDNSPSLLRLGTDVRGPTQSRRGRLTQSQRCRSSYWMRCFLSRPITKKYLQTDPRIINELQKLLLPGCYPPAATFTRYVNVIVSHKSFTHNNLPPTRSAT
jgi:hypothetical protein